MPEFSLPKRAIAAVLAGVLGLTGCTVRKVQQQATVSVPQPQTERIIGVTTVKGQDVSFDAPGATITDGVLHAAVKKAAYELPLDQVQRYWVERKEISTARTIGLVAGIAIPLAAIITVAVLAGKKSSPAPASSGSQQSCPFVYSWDGTEYVFDAEPYGGAIARGLEKDDYAEMEHLREEDGGYKLRMTNEVDETQMTNMTELWVVDHPAGARVVPDIQGKLHTVSAPQELLEAHDAAGRDLRPWLTATDHLIWEPASKPDVDGSLQGDIIMTFPKPADAKQAKLIANAATGMWGSYMIKRMVELRGRKVNDFYRAVNHSSIARKKLTAWEEREELYRLKVYVEEPTGWEVRGVLPGTGPYISKDRILPLDVSRVRGDTVRVRIHPPAGFWALNSFAMDYSAERPIKTQTVRPATAQKPDGRSVLAELDAVDGRYLAMPDIGDTADMTFVAPPATDGMERTVFLHTRGYYQLHLRDLGDPDKKMLAEFEKEPGAAARFATAQYGQWRVATAQIP